jgi:hypothetical protein
LTHSHTQPHENTTHLYTLSKPFIVLANFIGNATAAADVLMKQTVAVAQLEEFVNHTLM